MTGDQLEQWRVHTGMPVTKVVGVLGVSRNAWYTWVKGTQPVPKAIELACAAVSLGVRSYPPSSSSVEPTGADVGFVLAAPFTGPFGPPLD
jgi:hypothetical protein